MGRETGRTGKEEKNSLFKVFSFHLIFLLISVRVVLVVWVM